MTPTGTPSRSLTAIVLAAGKGTRMRSDLPKVLHRIAGRSMLGHVLAAVQAAGAGRIAVVAEPGRDDVAAEIARAAPGARVFPQAERLGTAHAVLAAREILADPDDDVVIAFGDTPLVSADTFLRLRAPLADGAAVAVLAFETATPAGYGRVLTEGDRVLAIREEKDASAAERAVTLCNAGLMALAGRHALALLARIGNDNAAGEYYLPDAVALAVADGLPVTVVPVDEAEAQGVNDRVQLSVAEAAIQAQLRRSAMLGGATLIAPETVFLSHDTVLGCDVIVEPHVVFGPGVRVAEGCTVRAFAHLTETSLEAGVKVGPFVRLRGHAVLEAGAELGNFVELKNARMGAGAKAAPRPLPMPRAPRMTARVGRGRRMEPQVALLRRRWRRQRRPPPPPRVPIGSRRSSAQLGPAPPRRRRPPTPPQCGRGGPRGRRGRLRPWLRACGGGWRTRRRLLRGT